MVRRWAGRWGSGPAGDGSFSVLDERGGPRGGKDGAGGADEPGATAWGGRAPVPAVPGGVTAAGRWRGVLAWLLLAVAVAAGLGPRVMGAAPVPAATGTAPQPAGPAAPPAIVRLHIIAHSDGPADQALKLQVRDALVPLLAETVAGARSPDEALARVNREAPRLEERAEAVVREAGFSYGVRIETGRFPYEERRLGETVYPAGIYPAVRVILGRGAGHNFWCVLFPGLCWMGDPGPAAEDGGHAGEGSPAASWAAVDPGERGGGVVAGVTSGDGATAPASPGGQGSTAWQQGGAAPRWFLLDWWHASLGRWWASLGWAQRAAAAH
ncbi:stage II sporulation protein R [Thermaerobacter litoralis]